MCKPVDVHINSAVLCMYYLQLPLCVCVNV